MRRAVDASASASARAEERPGDETDAASLVRNASSVHERLARERARIREKLSSARVGRFARAPTGALLDRVTGRAVDDGTEDGVDGTRSYGGLSGVDARGGLSSRTRAAEARAGALRDALRRAEAELADLRRESATGVRAARMVTQASDPEAVREAGARRGGNALGKAARKLALSRSLSKKRETGGSATEAAATDAEFASASQAPRTVRETVSKYQRDTTPQSITAREIDCTLPKPIFVVSDSTGATASKAVQAALGQFERCMHMAYPTNLEVFRFINDKSELAAIVEQARRDDALIVFTLAEAEMSQAMGALARSARVPYVNVWENLLMEMETHLELPLMNLPMIKRPSGPTETSAGADEALLSSDYYRMIEAVEYTRTCDDGASSHRWKEADILILGISRTGKTPLSIFLGQRGYKVANFPLVPVNGELRVPPHIADVDPRRVFGLIISPDVLHAIRTHRLLTMGVTEAESTPELRSRRSAYADVALVRGELALARALYAANPSFKVLDVTHKGVEETAARIMAVMSERFGRSHRLASLE